MLDYLLSAIGKPGRAVRGLLGGNFQEGLAALPFSDSLGITDPGQEVTSNDLVRQLAIDPDSNEGTVASLGVGIATDPLTYMGGALARGLLGRLAGKSPEMFDLASPAERALDAKNAAMVDRAFPVPERVAAPTAAERVTPALFEDGGHATMPAGELLRQIPDPESYAHLTGMMPETMGGLYSPAGGYGVAADRLAETGDRIGSFRTSLGAWDETLGDLERLHPELRGAMSGYAKGGHGQMELDWQYPIASRYNDLGAALRLGENGAIPADLVPLIEAQQARLLRLHRRTSSGSDDAMNAVQDIIGGEVAPSQAVRHAAEYMPHLPYDEASLRRVAAQGQQQSLLNLIDGEARDVLERAYGNGLLEPGVHDMSHLLENPTGRRALAETLSLGNPAMRGYEPSIVRRTIAGAVPATADNQELVAILKALREGPQPSGVVDMDLLRQLVSKRRNT